MIRSPMRTILLFIVLQGLVLAASTVAAQTTKPTQPTTSDPADLQQQAQELIKTASKLRQLKPRRRIEMSVKSKEEILAYVQNRLDQEYSPEEIETDAQVLKTLGLIPQTIDYRQTVLDLLADQVAGFYDPQGRTLHIASWLPVAIQGPALVHEICHALQDQHFGLKRFTKPIKNNSDQQLARAALVEGDCTAVMVNGLLSPLGVDATTMASSIDKIAAAAVSGAGGKIQSAPLFLRETLIFPYMTGLKLIHQIRSLSPYSEVNALFRRPPDTTEQVLHIEKLKQRERSPVFLVRPLPALTDYTLIKQDTLGELQLSILLQPQVSAKTAQRAAEGWDGDRLAAYRLNAPPVSTDPLLIIHLSSWDSPADAIEFTNAQRRVLIKRCSATEHTAIETARAPDTWRYTQNDALVCSVQLHGQYVLSMYNVPTAAHDDIQQSVWQKWKIIGRRLTAPPSADPAATN